MWLLDEGESSPYIPMVKGRKIFMSLYDTDISSDSITKGIKIYLRFNIYYKKGK